MSAKRSHWLSLDIPLTQHPLSKSVDLALFYALLDSAPDSHSNALTLSCSIPHAGDWLLMSSLRGPLVCIYSIVSFVCASCTGSVSLSLVKHLSVLSVMSLQTRLVTTMLGVGGMVT